MYTTGRRPKRGHPAGLGSGHRKKQRPRPVGPRALPRPPAPRHPPTATRGHILPAHLQPLRVHCFPKARPQASRSCACRSLTAEPGAQAPPPRPKLARDAAGGAGRGGSEPPLAASVRGRALAAGIAGPGAAGSWRDRCAWGRGQYPPPAPGGGGGPTRKRPEEGGGRAVGGRSPG